MKLVDCILISLAVSTSLLTFYVLDKGKSLQLVPREVSWYRKIVVHSPCKSVSAKTKINAHYIIDKNGIIQQTWAWEKSVPLEHTSDSEINKTSVAVIMESSSPLAYTGLANLVRTLQLDKNDVMIHNNSCPGSSFSMEELIKALNKK